jgi:hypothetical protein
MTSRSRVNFTRRISSPCVLPKAKENRTDALTEIGARFYDLLEAAFRLKIGWKYVWGRKVFTDKSFLCASKAPKANK